MNPLNTKIEFHILQSFPVSCLNRDDVGSPKTAMVGGVKRARVSSQCWKRQVRLEAKKQGVKLGIRTMALQKLIEKALLAIGAEADKATVCATDMAAALTKETVIFITETEIAAIAEYAKNRDFVVINSDKNKKRDDQLKSLSKDLSKVIKTTLNFATDGLDVALFGRMIAKATNLQVEGAASFNHALSTHKALNELDFFTAVDDLIADDETGSAHMGSAEYTSATYYRYICLDIGQLVQNFGGDVHPDDIKRAIEVFVKALYTAVPSARQKTMSAAGSWDYAKVLVRSGQPMQMCLDKPVISKTGYLEPSIKALNEWQRAKQASAGSLYQKHGEYEMGVNSDYSIDSLIADLTKHVE